MKHNAARWLAFAALAILVPQACATADATRRAGPASPDVRASVVWSSWSAEAFARARRERRPVLIHVAAVWCHWCHVMEEETYRDPRVVSLLQRSFVAIRVDGDARPDIAERYQRWGWPATAVLSPDAQPVLERRGFQPAGPFVALLEGVVRDLRAGRPVVRRPEPPPPPAGPADLERLRATAALQLDGYYDEAEHGWGSPQKYPYSAPVEHAFLRAHLRGEELWQRRALATLAGHARLVDPVWSGMYQYSVRGDWGHPHFEKIVPIQAGAIENFAEAYRVTGDERWRALALGIRGYLVRFLRSEAGAFHASQDADLGRHGEEGAVDGHEYYALGDAERRRLGIPRVDRSVYADLNGALVQALCRLYEATLDESVLQDALAAMAALEATHRTSEGGFAHAVVRDGLLHLADHVAVARAYVALHDATGDARWLASATAVADLVLSRLQDVDGGGFYAHSEDPAAVGVFAERRKPLEDNGSAARLLLRLHASTEEPRYREAALRALSAVARPEAIRADGRTIGELLLALEEVFEHRVHFTVVGRAGDAGTVALHREALRLHEPRKVIERSEPGAKYPDLGRAAVYLCDDSSCSNPLDDAATFARDARAFLAGLDRTGRN